MKQIISKINLMAHDILQPFEVIGIDGADKTHRPYSFILEDVTHEWELIITWTGRQDSKVAWCTVLTEVDGAAASLTGLSSYAKVDKDIMRAIFSLTSHWIEPINAQLK